MYVSEREREGENINVFVPACICIHVCVCVCMHACVHAHTRTCSDGCLCVTLIKFMHCICFIRVVLCTLGVIYDRKLHTD